MRKSLATAILFAALAIVSGSATRFPEAEISNGLIRCRLYLPDGTNGYYRGVRFDWSGVMPELEYNGHTYFGQWFDTYSPTLHDAIMGPVEDFSPVGYDEAKPGDNFLKIGVGMVARPDEQKYFFATPYSLINPGVWTVKKRSDKAEFIHRLNDKEYGYEYHKIIRLEKDKPEMVLWHSLKNTGKRTIETNVYDHNFFTIDSEKTGQSFTVKFPFTLATASGDSGTLGKIQGNRIIFLRGLAKNEHLYYTLSGFDNNANDYDIRIENHKTGAAVRITADQPLSKLSFWSAIKTICPEPFIKIKINPGETFAWKISYHFYICDTLN